MTDVARAIAAGKARENIKAWPNKAARTLALSYVKTIEDGGDAIPAGLANIAVAEIDAIFAAHGIIVREQIAAVKVHSTATNTGKKGKRPRKQAA